MRRNVVSIGNKPISGEVGKIYAAGEVNIKDADVLKLNGAGKINIEDSYIAEGRIGGNIIANDSTFGTFRYAGEMILKGECKADTLVAVGKLDAEQLECGVLRNFSESSIQIYNEKNRKEASLRFGSHWDFNINAMKDFVKDGWDINYDTANTEKEMKCDERYLNLTGGSIFKGDIKAETFENLCNFKIDFKYKFKNVLSIDPLHLDGVLECEELYGFGILDMEGVNADVVYIHPHAESKLQQVMGSEITISDVFLMDQSFENIPKSADVNLYKRAAASLAGQMQLDTIEGDTITLDHVQARLVSGDNITIGDFCIIDCVEYKDTIQISPKAAVKEVIKL